MSFSEGECTNVQSPAPARTQRPGLDRRPGLPAVVFALQALDLPQGGGINELGHAGVALQMAGGLERGADLGPAQLGTPEAVLG